jgi:hypothetical protein
MAQHDVRLQRRSSVVRRTHINASEPEFPFFTAMPARDLSVEERDTLIKLLETAESTFSEQVATLRVVGRCGCGQCPTVFFERHEPNVHEQDLSTYVGRDKVGGLVGVVLMQRRGRLSQLEFYSVDGHDPWYPPAAEDLAPHV